MANTNFTGPVYSTNGFVGDLTGNVAGNTVSTITTFSGAGAIPITAGVVKLTTTGANALTLADGTDGQVITITCVVNAGTGTMTPATKTGFSTVAFTALGNSTTLRFFTTLGWMVVNNYGSTVA